MIDIDVQICESYVDKDRLVKLAEYICDQFGLQEPEINICVMDNYSTKNANNKYLSHDYVTDVISFDMSDDQHKCFDIIVNGELAMEKARELGHLPLAELALYMTHGMLHNLEFDDSDEEKAEKMHLKEDEILQAVGFGVVYNDKNSGA